jgi:hypothetical protein
LYFESADDAVAYAKRLGLAHRVEQPKDRVIRGASYSDNFRFDRSAPWTH